MRLTVAARRRPLTVVKSDDVMLRLIKTYGIRRAVMLFGAASVAAARGWDAMVGDEAYSRQAVWMWTRDRCRRY